MDKNSYFADIKEMFAELREAQKKTDQQIEKTDRQIEATNRQMEKTDRQMEATNRHMEETDRRFNEKWDKLCEKLGGITDNIGYHAEQFFQNVFREKLEFGGIKYDRMVPNLKYRGNKDEVEFDIALINGDSIALIEVKHRIHLKSVKEIAENKIEKFRKFFHEFKDYNAYLGIVGFSFCDGVLDLAGRYGIGIARQVGDSVEISTEKLKVY